MRYPYEQYRDQQIVAYPHVLQWPGVATKINDVPPIWDRRTAKTEEVAEANRHQLWLNWIGFQREEASVQVARAMIPLRLAWNRPDPYAPEEPVWNSRHAHLAPGWTVQQDR